MYEFSVPLAVTDFIPVILFGIAAVLMQRDLYNKMPKYSFACFSAGCVNMFMAGFLKALWKLLYALGICDFHVLNTMFLPTQSLGLLAGLGIVIMFIGRRKAALAVKLQKKKLIIVFALCFLCYMGMGYLASKKDGSAASNWIEQGVNTLGQILLLCGVRSLHKAGLRELKLN